MTGFKLFATDGLLAQCKREMLWACAACVIFLPAVLVAYARKPRVSLRWVVVGVLRAPGSGHWALSLAVGTPRALQASPSQLPSGPIRLDFWETVLRHVTGERDWLLQFFLCILYESQLAFQFEMPFSRKFIQPTIFLLFSFSKYAIHNEILGLAHDLET